ncbi:hypothetical protein Pmani_025085 [Petrolisthes manimaculis]|uniref:Ferritin n=1 Tax=Petrolisthes manimaculis TaxID=1843537 RepID=A0AAE1P8Q2_9EUCA|nr:hypothetical protein Pmani_025085 [Petrolisthes manimaculis]
MNFTPFLVFLALVAGALADFSCTASGGGEFPKTVCYDDSCTNKIVSHIQEEFNAAFKYLYMASKLGQYTVARPGITKFLLESASEERSHAMQMLDYLDTRGISYPNEYNFAKSQVENFGIPGDKPLETGIENVLKKSIEMEIHVTNLIKGVIDSCSNDFHAADVFTNPILDEQHLGLRKLQGALQTLKAMKNAATEDEKKVAEYFFDLKLQKGELL